MNSEAAKQPIDELLLPFVNARTEPESDIILEQLILNHAQPLIRDIVSFKLKAYSSRWVLRDDEQEVDDISGDVILRLVRTLRSCRSPEGKAIASLRSYVAAMSYNASDQYLRQKYPRRFSLKNKVRYIITHRPGLALWESEGRGVLCGFSSWRQLKVSAVSLKYDQSRDDLEAFLRDRFRDSSIEQVNPADLVTAVFEFAGSPLEMDELVTVMAEICGVRESHHQPHGEYEALDDRSSSAPRRLPDAAFDQKESLTRVWNEILELPPRQRVALLLNLRDENGGTAMSLLPMLRVASIQQIGDALGLQPEEFAALWNELPLEDSKIGERLGATRQQVANLRKCARERLTRRLNVAARS